MSLTESDRQWVKDMIGAATVETLNKGRDFARGQVEGHVKSCPNVSKLKWIIFGIGLGLGSQIPLIAKSLSAIF